ncbi:hypothetical protein HBI06_228600 [Parastagonospora nodorum]|nr:hypothetical protein HBI06_228600 [Parastagonospora nodorum]
MHKPSFYYLIYLDNIIIAEYICTANARRIVRGLENSASASLLIYSNYALQEYSLLNICSNLQTHIIRQIRIEITAAYALNYLKLQVLKLTLIGTVLYNAIKEYYNNRTRKTIYFYSYTIETIYANYIKNSRSNVTMLDNYYNNNVNNILIKYYNCAEKREDNILTIDKCRTSYSNKKDIEANERETRVQLRELLEEIHDILLREFRKANDFIESIIYNNDEQLEDCDALVERYEEEINCSDLYSTV